MKLFKKIRKGFTLIELVVVIAVIAILSAVSVVSYVAITNAAKKSSDEQAVRQMNTALKASGLLSAKDINELYAVLLQEGMDAKNYKPLSKDTYFFWDQEDNQIVYAKWDSKSSSYVGMYPESYKDKTKGNHHWFSLSKEIQTISVPKTNDNKYEIASAEALYTIVSDKRTVSEVKLTGNVDLMGADLKLSGVSSFDGGNHTLTNLSQLVNEGFDVKQNEKTNSGLFGEIKQSVTIKDVVIENSVVGSSENKFCGILGGAVRGSGTVVTVDNVTIKDSTVYALQKGGIFFGYAPAGTIKIKSNVTVTGCKVATLYGEAGKLVGAMEGGATLVNESSALSGVTLEALPTDYKELVSSVTGTRDTIQKNSTTPKQITGGHFVYNQSDAKNTSSLECFRYFNADAITCICSYADAGKQQTVNYGVSDSALNAYKGSTSQKALTVSGHAHAQTYGAFPLTPDML